MTSETIRLSVIPESTSDQGHCTGVSLAAMARPQVVLLLLLLSLLLASTVRSGSMPWGGDMDFDIRIVEGVASLADCQQLCGVCIDFHYNEDTKRCSILLFVH